MAWEMRSSFALNVFASVATPVVGLYVLVSRHEDPVRVATYVLVLSALAAIATVAAARPRRSVLLFAGQALSVALYIVLVMATIFSVGVYFATEGFALLAALVLTARARTPPLTPSAT